MWNIVANKYRAGDRVWVLGSKGTIKRVVDDPGYSMFGNYTEYEVEFDDPLSSTISIFPESAINPYVSYEESFGTLSANYPKCECGVDTVKSGKHSSWCPKHGRD